MSQIVRFSVSLEDDLLAEFDRCLRQEHTKGKADRIGGQSGLC